MPEETASDHSVIGSDRVEGKTVFGRNGDKIGTVRRIMIDKISGQARDVEVSVGTFLGMGGELHSLPWEKLKFDPILDGYQLDVTEDELRNAPTHKESDRDRQYDQDYQREVYTYWVVTPYW